MLGGSESNIETQAVASPNRYAARFRDPIFGTLFWSWIAYLAGSYFAFRISLQPAGVYGLLLIPLVLFLRFKLKTRRLRKLEAADVKMRKQINELEKSAAESEIALARQSGAFDRWEKK